MTTLGSRGYFFLIDISRRSRVNEAQKKKTSGHRSTQPHFHARSGSNISPIPRSEVVRCSQSGPLLHCQFPADMGVSNRWPSSISELDLAWKRGCVLLWPEVIFFSPALCALLTRLRREISIRKKYPLEPRVDHWRLFQDFSTTQIEFSRALKFTLTPTIPRS